MPSSTGATAGGMATPAGAVYNPVTLGLLERLTAYSVTFAQWTSTGVILTAAHLPICYLVLTLMLRPEVQAIPDRARLRRELARLGPMSRGEKNVLFVLVVMLVLWILPTFVSIEFLDIWYAPPVAMVLLFALPVDARGRPTLEAGDVREGVGWNVLFLVLGGMALADVLASVGRDRLARGPAHGQRHRRRVAVGGGPRHAAAHATGQRARRLGDGCHDAVPDRRRPRLQLADSRPHHRGHGRRGDAPLGQRRGGRDVRVRRRRTRDDVQDRRRRHRPDVARHGPAEHLPGAGPTGVRGSACRYHPISWRASDT